MSENYIKVKDLADELGMTVSNLNIQIAKGHAGEVEKTGDGETKDYALSVDNVLAFIKWSRVYGRSNKKMLREALSKYKAMVE